MTSSLPTSSAPENAVATTTQPLPSPSSSPPSASTLSEPPAELTCPVCMHLKVYPILLSCGHGFCMHCISQYWGNPQTTTKSCPLCRKACPSASYTRDNLLEHEASKYYSERDKRLHAYYDLRVCHRILTHSQLKDIGARAFFSFRPDTI